MPPWRLLLVACVALLVACPRPLTPPAERARPAPARAAVEASERRERHNVVLVTIDGVRWQDALDHRKTFALGQGRPAMPHLVGAFARAGALFGDPRQQSLARVSARRPMSLPGYLAITHGRMTDCRNNHCPRTAEETFLERVARELALPPTKVAVFASWSAIARAASHADGTIFTDIPPDGDPREGGPPWPDARFDEETARRALTYLEEERPRLLWISLLDPDERAHAREKAGYLEALGAADAVLARLDETLTRMPGYGEHTTVLVTTDHGRGEGPFWTSHSRFDVSRAIFLGARGPLTRPVGVSASEAEPLEQADVRPTIERLLGLCPTSCAGCGAPIPEVVAGAAADGCGGSP
jgi:hypothetical protein